MLQFFRDGFYRDFIVLMLVTIIVGTAVSSGVAWAVDEHFGDTITDIIGDHGEYDLMLHVRAEAKDAAIRELERIADQEYPGAKISDTITIAGQANLFFGFPEEYRTQSVFSQISAIFNGVPGLNGYTVVVEPSVLVRGVHGSVFDELQTRFNEISGVKFSFKDKANMLVLLESVEHSKTVTSAINQILAEYEILELRFPMGFEVDTQQTAKQAIAAIKAGYHNLDITDVSSAEYGAELDAFVKALVEMRQFLVSYASKVTIDAEPGTHLTVGEQIVVKGAGEQAPKPGNSVSEDQVVVEITDLIGDRATGIIVRGSIQDATAVLEQPGYRKISNDQIGTKIGQVKLENERYQLQYTINESLRLLEELDELAVEAANAVDNADTLLTTFQEALMQLEVLQVQIKQLYEGLQDNGTQSTSEQLIVSLLFNGLLKNLTQSEIGGEFDNKSLELLENLDIEAMRLSINNLAQQITNVQTIDVQAIIDQITSIRDSLPQLDDEEIGQSIRLIDSYILGQVIPGERIQLLVKHAEIEEELLQPVIRAELNNEYVNTYLTSVGMVNPDTRTEVFRVLKEIRATIAGLLAIIFVAGFLILDHATVFSALKWVRSNKKSKPNKMQRFANPLVIFSALVGMIMLLAIYQLSNAEIPFISLPTVAMIGLILGGVIGLFSEKFSPVNAQEMIAGLALGLSNVQIMREIVIPASRPGLLNLLNRMRQKF